MHKKLRLMKRVVILCLLISVVLSVNSAVAGTVEEALKANMKKVYDKALKNAGVKDFDGWCGNCTGYQLQAAGVFSGLKSANGNASYRLYKSSNPGSGLSVTAFPGKYESGSYTIKQICNLLNDINLDGLNTYAAFCFETGSSSADGQKYGHVLLVHAVFDGKVYWGESFGEQTRVASIASFASKYAESGKTYHFDGAVVFGYKELQERLYTKVDSDQRIGISVKASTAADTCRLQSAPYDEDKYNISVLEKDAIVNIEGAVDNRYGNRWYIVVDETGNRRGYVWSGDVEVCPMEKVTAYVISTKKRTFNDKDDQCYAKALPYEDSLTKGIMDKGEGFGVDAKLTNKHGNVWYRLTNGLFVYGAT